MRAGKVESRVPEGHCCSQRRSVRSGARNRALDESRKRRLPKGRHCDQESFVVLLGCEFRTAWQDGVVLVVVVVVVVVVYMHCSCRRQVWV